MTHVDLFYLSPNPYGGWVTYTNHLMEAFKAVDVKCTLFKIRPKSERKSREFGYGKHYRNISMAEAKNRKTIVNNEYKPTIKIVVAGAKQFKEETQMLYDIGASIVVHDPTELKNLPVDLDPKRCVVIRQIGARTFKGATFIRHPYKPFPKHNNLDRKGSVSTSRIDFDKHTEILLDANRLLPEDKKTNIRGFENRIFTRFKIVPKYPEWVQSKAHYPREDNFAFNLMKDYTFNVDMTQIVGDGGGTQYTGLESWNAGCIPIIHNKWILDEPDDMKPDYNCFAIGSAEELSMLLNGAYSDSIPQIRENGYNALKLHDPILIGNQYKQFLNIE